MPTGIYPNEKRNMKGLELGRLKGKHHTEETKKKLSEYHKGWRVPNSGFKKGNIPWNKNKIINRDKYPNIGHFKKHSDSSKQKMSIAKLGIRWSKEDIRKRLIRRTPSSLEQKMMDIIQRLNLPYKFVGDGKFFIENKCPDFINCNGEKVAIEVFWRGFKTKKCFHGLDLERWKEERRRVFKKYGWEIIFFNETEVNEEEVSIKLGKVVEW